MMKLFENFQKKRLIFYKRWLEYIPNEWNIDEILEKKVKDLTDLELDRLQQVRTDWKYAEVVDKFINMIDNKIGINSNDDILVGLVVDYNDYTNMSKVINYFDFDAIALSKLSESELDYINNIIDNYDCNGALSELSKLGNEYAREYAGYLLEKKNNKQFHRELAKHYEELSKMRQLGCSKVRWLHSINN